MDCLLGVYTDNSKEIESIGGINTNSIDAKVYLGVIFNFGDK